MANEKRLIDVKQAIAEMNRVETNRPYDDKEDILEKCVNILYAAPTVDAVEVVRCKDCKKWMKCEPSGTNCRVCADTTRIRLPYDFCSYGERREGE